MNNDNNNNKILNVLWLDIFEKKRKEEQIKNNNQSTVRFTLFKKKPSNFTDIITYKSMLQQQN